MAQENEHKYLVKSSAWRKQARQGEHYRQGYLSTDPERNVRVRVSGDKAVLTIKGSNSGDHNGLQRAEFEYRIPVTDANQLLDDLCRRPVIEKTRFRISQNGNTWEVDKFGNENEGLVIAELETSKSGAPSRLPSWIGEDVSNDDRYDNANLVDHPYSEWRPGNEKPDPKYHWKAGENVADGLRRIVAEQLESAVWELSADQGPADEAVHEARKCLKRARSAMRLLRDILGDEYEQGNGALRDAGRKLSPLRDSQALIEVFDELNHKYRDDLGDGSLISIREGLVKRKKALGREFQQKRTRGEVVKILRVFAKRSDKWNGKQADVAALSNGFARTIQRNRRACRAAYAESRPERFHEWRKRAKDLRYHLSLVSKAWPEVLDGFEAAAKDLESKLGDDHNLVVMRDTILGKPDMFGAQKDVAVFLSIIDDHQKKLRSECRTLGDRLYSEGPKSWRRRLEQCWTAWKQEHE